MKVYSKEVVKSALQKARDLYTFVLLKYLTPKGNRNKVVLIPPTDLIGSFGDELMVNTFISQFSDRQVIIYARKNIIRDDFLGQYKNIEYLSWQRYPKFLKYCAEVHVLGADNMDGGYGERFPLQKLRFLDFAHRLGLKTSIMGFSINKRLTESIKLEMQAGSSYNIYNLRDVDSFERASQFLPAPAIRQTADTAFLCPYSDLDNPAYEQWIKTQKDRQKFIVAVCPNAIQAQKIGLSQYLENMSKAIRAFVEFRPSSFVFLYHDLRDHCDGLSDREVSYQLFSMLKNTMDCYYVEGLENGIALKSYLSPVDCTFTGRMHFGISGLSLKKPMLGISYQDKFTGLMKLFGINATSCVVEYTHLNESADKIRNFLETFEEIQLLVNQNLHKVKGLAKRNFEQC